MILKCQKLPLGTANWYIFSVTSKMNICKRCSAVRSWRRCSNLDASDRSTQIPHKSPLGKEPWCESDWSQTKSLHTRHVGKLKDLKVWFITLDYLSDVCSPGLFLLGLAGLCLNKYFHQQAILKVFKTLGPRLHFPERPGQHSLEKLLGFFCFRYLLFAWLNAFRQYL